MNKTEFWAAIDKESSPGGCWLWSGARDLKGYGRVRHQGKSVLAHRLAYELAYGVVADGVCVCHQCDNPQCCNPAHLFSGTKAANNQDMMRKGRHASVTAPGYHAKGERHGSAKLTDRQAAEIAAAYKNGGVTQRALAAQYGVSQRTVAKIALGIGWKHVTNTDAKTEGIC